MTAGVVIADDDADIRALVSLAVRRAGGRLLAEVGDGQAALDAIRRGGCRLAVLDVAMPRMTGLEVCAAVRADPATAGVLVLLVSASVQPLAIAAGASAGADRFIEKPFGVRALADEIGRLLDPTARHREGPA